MRDFTGLLIEFNSKERYYVVERVFRQRNEELIPTSDFAAALSECLKIQVGAITFAAIDYHIDWLAASLALVRSDPSQGVHRIRTRAKTGARDITATIQDLDLLVVAKAARSTQVFMLEAKGIEGFDRSQLEKKLDRLVLLFGQDGRSVAGFEPHFSLLSPKEPSRRLRCETWPEWALRSDGRPNWMPLDMGGHKSAVVRCDPDGRTTGEASHDGGFWKVETRR